MVVLYRAEQQLAYYSQYVDCRDDNRAGSGDYEYAVEHIGILERTEEDCHLRNEA